MRLAIALAVVMGLMLLMEQSAHWQRLMAPLNIGLAQATEFLLRQMELPVTRHGAVLAHPDGFSYRITYVCAGIRPAALILVTLLIMPASWASRIAGLAVALVGIEALNLLRLVHLYWTGVVDREAFHVAHRLTWNIIAVVAVLIFLAVWLAITGQRRATQQRIPLL